MGLGDIAGVFSRYFVVGFFLPAFGVLAIAAVAVSDCLLPNAFERQSYAAEIAVLGATGVFVGLLLQGLNYSVLRGYQGYGLQRAREWLESPKRHPRWKSLASLTNAVYSRLQAKQKECWQELYLVRDHSADGEKQAIAGWKLDLNYPRDAAHLLPTAFGNAIRAFETHSNHRWGLDGIAATPRIGAFMSEKEHELHADAKADAMFFVNISLLLLVLGLVLLVDLAVAQPLSWLVTPVYVLPFAASYAAYRGAIGAARRWGSVVRSEIDLHRLELYEKMGVRAPASFSEERNVIGPAVSRCILHGNRLPDELSAHPYDSQEKEQTDV